LSPLGCGNKNPPPRGQGFVDSSSVSYERHQDYDVAYNGLCTAPNKQFERTGSCILLGSNGPSKLENGNGLGSYQLQTWLEKGNENDELLQI